MQHTLPDIFLERCRLHLLIPFLLLFSISSCTVTDIEYAQRLRNARTNCTGKEIIGIWVSQAKYAGLANKYILLIRPDRTGIWRSPNDIIRERKLTWQYDGHGTWQQQWGPRSGPIRYDGQCLLLESRSLDVIQLVFVPGDDEAAIDEHLRLRKR